MLSALVKTVSERMPITAELIPPTPGQRGAADDHRGDGKKRPLCAGGGAADAGDPDQQQAGDGRAEAADAVDGDENPVDVNAGATGPLFVAADGVDVLPEDGGSQHEQQDQHNCQEGDADQ